MAFIEPLLPKAKTSRPRVDDIHFVCFISSINIGQPLYHKILFYFLLFY